MSLKSFLEELKTIQADVEPFLDKLLKLTAEGSQIAEVVGTATGNPEVAAGAAAAGSISTALDNIVAAHIAGGATQASAIASVASLANAVTSANIPGVSPETVQGVAAIVAQVATVAPEVAAAIVPIPPEIAAAMSGP